MKHVAYWSRRILPVFSLLVVVGLYSTLTACSAPPAQAAQAPTLQPTETASPLVTPTLVASSTPAALPSVNWSDLSVYKKAMKPGFETDVDQFADANRYLIVARLTFEEDAIIRGAERVRFVNRSKDPMDQIVFRLYANVPFMGGRMNVTHITAGDKVINPTLSVFRSVMSAPLDKPLAPGDAIELTLDFDVVLPRGLNASYGRFGYEHNVVSATAWYPTLSVYDQGRGWWETLPSSQGDPAYTETGLYDVRLTTPADQTVVMSGKEIETTQNSDGTVTHRNITGPMRDHAFQSSSRYKITSTMVDGTRINVVYYKEEETKASSGTASVIKFAAQSIHTYNTTFGDYPFSDFYVVENPTPTGVEFPGLVQIAESAWVNGNPFLETVVAHETGHQWFYSLVGNNQVEHPWLDESITSYTEFVYMRAIYPTGPTADDYVKRFQRGYNGYIGAGFADQPLDMPVYSYNSVGYGLIIYTKGPLFFVELERELGRDTVYKALSVYFKNMKYKVSSSAEVKHAFEEVTGKDLSEVFHKWVGDFPDPYAKSP